MVKLFFFIPCNMVKGGKHSRNEIAITTLANNIRKYRNERKLTIMELSELINVDYSQVSRMERGTVNSNVSVIFDIAIALQIKPAQLLEE